MLSIKTFLTDLTVEVHYVFCLSAYNSELEKAANDSGITDDCPTTVRNGTPLVVRTATSDFLAGDALLYRQKGAITR